MIPPPQSQVFIDARNRAIFQRTSEFVTRRATPEI
jgi:hypothetical protein